ncbi:hypothetical protein [Alkaliphilus peptidifermentans]|uniref:Phage-related protein n=1 Tax=Alkaliphilus peptidifermentans DSM 18978 TaxID=1120976 RepID=A0A1G5JXC0_9FIRM|nr:hypothetical protein [Alkaliphilus peptidifermentans]SCY93015.1 Phage-related protein [Alkaliphilus peptidifermentans DSM 18978]
MEQIIFPSLIFFMKVGEEMVVEGVLSLKDKNFSTGIKYAIKNLKSFESEIKNVAAGIKEHIGGANKALGQLNKNDIIELKSAVADLNTEVDNVILYASRLGDNMQTIKKLGIDAFESIKKNSGIFKEAYNDIKQWGIETFEDIKEEIMGKFAEGFMKGAKKGLEVYENLKQKFDEKFGETFNNIKEWGSNAFKSISATVTGVVGGAYENIKQWSIDTFENIKETASNKFNEAFSNIKEWSNNTAQVIKGKFQENFGEAFEGINKKAKTVFEEMMLKSMKFADKFGGIGEKSGNAFENIKKKSIDFEETLKGVHESGVAAFEGMKLKIAENQQTIDSIKGVISDVETNVKGLKDSLLNTFESAQPVVGWLKDNGLPGVGDFISNIADKAMGLHNFIDNNWTKFRPIIEGVSFALEVYEGATAAVQNATEIYTHVTGGLVKVQGFLNKVMASSPWGMVALAIGAVIAVGILVWKNWDTIKEKAMELWAGIQEIFGGVADFFFNVWNSAIENIKGAFEGIKDVFTGVMEFIKETIGGCINFIIKPINFLIDGINSISFKVPDWVPGIGGKELGINIPNIPEFALGTSYAREGLALIHEQGGEIRHTSRGETIIPADKSKSLIENINNSPSITININGSNMTPNDVINEMVPKLKLALANI